MTSRRSSKEGSDFIDSATGISVAVRIRPLNQRELRSDERNAITFNDQSIRTKSSPSLSFGFDHVLDPNATNRDVYEAVGMDIVKSTMIGINSTIFAYGQTSTGKTHTMFGSPEDPGITRLAVADIFKSINNDKSRQYLMRGSYMEIYNEMIKDLLKPENNNLKVHQHPTGEVFVGELSERMLTSFQDVMNLLEVGDKNRHIGETNMNELSSRSHTIFRMTIESQDKAGLVRVSLLNLVDLAGSERVGHTGAEGQRLVEGGHINKSLLSLGTVIAKLSEGDSSHIPFRDSKLTRILQSSLGGNAKTSIVCTVTPASIHIDETLSTLRFASRAKKITNHYHINEVVSDTNQLKIYKKEIGELKRKLEYMEQISNQKKEEKENIENGKRIKTSPQDLDPFKTETRFHDSIAHICNGDFDVVPDEWTPLVDFIKGQNLKIEKMENYIKTSQELSQFTSTEFLLMKEQLQIVESENQRLIDTTRRLRYEKAIDDIAGTAISQARTEILRENLEHKLDIKINALNDATISKVTNFAEQLTNPIEVILQSSSALFECLSSRLYDFDTSMNVLNSRFVATKSLTEQLKTKIEALEQQLDSSSKQLLNSEAMRKELETNSAIDKQQLADLRGLRNAIEAEILPCMDNISMQTEVPISVLQFETVQNFISTNSSILHHLSELKKSLDAKSSMLAELNKVVIDKDQFITDLQCEVVGKEEAAQSKIHALIMEKENIAKELQEMTEKVNDLQQVYKKIDQCTETGPYVETRVQELLQEVELTRAINSDLSSSKEAMQEEYNSLDRAFKDIESRYQTSERYLSMSLDSLSAMSARIQGVDGKILKAQQIQSKLHFKSSSIQSQITSRDRLINELSVKNTQSLADLKESESKAIEYIQESINLQSCIDKMKSTARARGEIILDQVDVFKSDQKKLMAIQRDLASNVNNTFSELITVRDKAKQLQNQLIVLKDERDFQESVSKELHSKLMVFEKQKEQENLKALMSKNLKNRANRLKRGNSRLQTVECNQQ